MFVVFEIIFFFGNAVLLESVAILHVMHWNKSPPGKFENHDLYFPKNEVLNILPYSGS